VDSVAAFLARQCGVIARHQVFSAGGDDSFIERMLRQRRWARVRSGVYVDHTGEPSWPQRAWAAVLYAAPSALAGPSALRAHGVRGHDSDAGIHLVIGHDRRLRSSKEVRVERVVDFERVAQTHLSPPRVRIEHAVLRLASAARSEDAAVAVLADACQSGRTTAQRLLVELAAAPRLKRRTELARILDDVVSGTMSALERRYLRDVERAHGLPPGRRQVREATDDGVVVRDVLYSDQDTLMELDGRLGHEWAVERWDDLDRDIAAAVSGRLTMRAGWRQVLQPCRLARAVAVVLAARGWSGAPRPCGSGCLFR
jgi:hypothetical protein